jgi:UDP-GlcNAc3NAcA epimerase
VKICTIIGARPQFIKAAVVSRAIRESKDVSEILVHTGQHFDANMSDVFFEELDIKKPDFNLKVGGGTHGQNTGRMLESVEKVLIDEKPDCVLVYGDTDSTLAGALAAVKLHIPIAHVEAGLRSFNRMMPEELNRLLTDHASDLLFTPTITAVENLRKEGIEGHRIHQVGDVMYDATIYYKSSAKRPDTIGNSDDSYILCTIHRAENTNDLIRLMNIVNALNDIAVSKKIILPIHPRTAQIIKKSAEINLHPNILIIEPVGFLEMQWLLQYCLIVMTDSGGVQKEAFFHGKPCVTLRDETEWVELVKAGVNIISPPIKANILTDMEKALSLKVDQSLDLYGNGTTGNKIVDIILEKI